MRKYNDTSVAVGVGDNVFSCISVVKKIVKSKSGREETANMLVEAFSKKSYSEVIRFLDTIVEVSDIDKLEEYEF